MIDRFREHVLPLGWSGVAIPLPTVLTCTSFAISAEKWYFHYESYAIARNGCN
ncbi:hypothetical protein BDV24DRAFT_122514 [Aspergillus arachidicola]|uniref:Uncharacterized protein n=1 Tax=Aspergillus arachidicola TaxID=656916 RepID=A0A5N6YQQ1_9EURO|nr:hypothetical protein BDV24DRAFT_122514 [Aspergillus arachidicola]